MHWPIDTNVPAAFAERILGRRLGDCPNLPFRRPDQAPMLARPTREPRGTPRISGIR
jgi:hypothetical protein